MAFVLVRILLEVQGGKVTSPLLVLDCHYLCHRAFHAQGKQLAWKGRATGVIFGFFQSILSLKEEFATERIAFCFESPKLKRKQIFPEYKAHRHNREFTLTEKQAMTELHVQINQLRTRYLPQVGFKNIFCFEGMESDDIMARLAQRRQDEVILVTSDSDLWQCLSDTVSIYQPVGQKLLTRDWFVSKFDFEPRKWAVIKAIAGCAGDGVPGLPGVGEITAAKYLQGKLPFTSKAYQKITGEDGKFMIRRNRDLVCLPLDACPTPDLQEDKLTTEGWQKVCQELGFKSLLQRPPWFSKNKTYERQQRFLL